jgi:hypothetical protein
MTPLQRISPFAQALHLQCMSLVVAFFWATLAIASQPFNLYFVAVGSSVYLQPSAPGLHGFHELGGMNASARLVADRLQQAGATFGVLLTADVDRQLAVGLPDIKAAIARIETVLQRTSAKDVLLIFYFAGHGISEGIAWNHFSVPGNLVYRGAANELGIDELAQKTLHAASLVDDLERLGVHYAVLLDTCYEGTEASFESPVLTGKAIQNLRDSSASLKFINEFHQVDPVLFSTMPGTKVERVKDPTDPKSLIGRLARRVILTIDDAAHSHREVSLGDFIRFMTSPSLDSITNPAVTNATPDPVWSRSMLTFGRSPGHVEERQGTAEALDVCGEDAGKDTEGDHSPPSRSKLMHGNVQISGSAGEYISDGENLQFSSPSDQFTVDDSHAGEILIEVNSGGVNFWEIELATPDKRAFSPGRYDRAQRNGFSDPGHPGLSISGPGRGCNEVAGSFTVKEVGYNAAGRLQRLSASAIQRCDGAHASLRASVDLWEGPGTVR